MDEPYSRFEGDCVMANDYQPRYNEIMGNPTSTGYYESPVTPPARPSYYTPPQPSYYTFDAVNSYRDFTRPAQYTDQAVPYVDVAGGAPRPLFGESQVVIPARIFEAVVMKNAGGDDAKKRGTKQSMRDRAITILLVFISVLIAAIFLTLTYTVVKTAVSALRDDDI